MDTLLIYVYNICWPTTTAYAYYNTKCMRTNAYIKIPKDSFNSKTERDKFIDYTLQQINGVKPLPYEYGIEYVCHL